MPSRKTHIPRLAIALVLGALAAPCAGGQDLLIGQVSSQTSPVTSVNAKGLPATMYSDTGYTVEATAGTITVTADNKYTGSMTTRETVDGKASIYVDHASGTWVQTGNAITLTPTGGAAQSGTWSGTSLTINQSDGVFVYSRAR